MQAATHHRRMAAAPAWTPDIQKAIGARIRDARNAKGFSLRSFAQRMELSHGTLGHWETGTNEIPLEKLWKVCLLLGVSADKLLFDVERWPFDKVSYDKVSDLESADRHRLEGALLSTATDLGIDIRKAEPTAIGGAQISPADRDLAPAVLTSLSTVPPERSTGKIGGKAPTAPSALGKRPRIA